MTTITTTQTQNVNVAIQSPLTIAQGITYTIAQGVTVTVTETAQATGNETLAFVIESQTKVLALLEKVATGTNRLAVLKNGVLYVVNKTQTSPPVATFFNHQILEWKVTQADPLKTLTSLWPENVPYASRAKLVEEQKKIQVSVLGYGAEHSIDALSQNEGDIRNRLLQIRDSKLQSSLSATVSGIQNFEIGDRLLFKNTGQNLEGTQTIFGFAWDFEKEQTTFTGPVDLVFGVGI